LEIRNEGLLRKKRMEEKSLKKCPRRGKRGFHFPHET